LFLLVDQPFFELGEVFIGGQLREDTSLVLDLLASCSRYFHRVVHGSQALIVLDFGVQLDKFESDLVLLLVSKLLLSEVAPILAILEICQNFAERVRRHRLLYHRRVAGGLEDLVFLLLELVLDLLHRHGRVAALLDLNR